MIRHPSYPGIWGYITHVTLDPRLPLFLACIEKIGEPGDEATLEPWWLAQKNVKVLYILVCAPLKFFVRHILRLLAS